MTETNGNRSDLHLDYIDSARGIAAMMVMGSHFLGWQYGDCTGNKVASLFFNGNAAVSFFFVLSGFVLSYQYVVLNRPLDLRKYTINRIIRLWPAFFITIVICVFNQLWLFGFSWQSAADLFIRNKNQFWEEAIIFWSTPNYYGPGWTLTLELGASLFLPFLIALTRQDKRYVYWLAAVMLLFGRALGMGFMVFFAGGLIISCIFDLITQDAFKNTRYYRFRYLLVPLAVLLFSLQAIDLISTVAPSLIYLLNYIGTTFYTISAFGAFGIITAIISTRSAKKMLRNPVLLYLGRISYGIYLMHYVLNTDLYFFKDAIMKHFSDKLFAYLFIFVLYIAATILLATLLHRVVELPFIRMGKRMTQRMKPSIIV